MSTSLILCMYAENPCQASMHQHDESVSAGWLTKGHLGCQVNQPMCVDLSAKGKNSVIQSKAKLCRPENYEGYLF